MSHSYPQSAPQSKTRKCCFIAQQNHRCFSPQPQDPHLLQKEDTRPPKSSYNLTAPTKNNFGTQRRRITRISCSDGKIMAPNHSESQKQKAHTKNKTKKSGLARHHEKSQKPAEDDTCSIINHYCCDSEGEFYHESRRNNHKNEHLATHTKKSRKKLHVRQEDVHNDDLSQHQKAQTPSSNYHCEDNHQKNGCNHHQENDVPEKISGGDIDENYVGLQTRLPYLVSTGVMHFKLDSKTEQWLSSIITLMVQDNMRAYEKKVQSELEGMFSSYKDDRHHSFLVLDRFADGFVDFKRKIDEMSKKINHLENELHQQQCQYNQKPPFINNQEKLSSSYFGGHYSSSNTFQTSAAAVEKQQQLQSIMQFNSPAVVAQQLHNATPHRLIDSKSPSYSFPLQTSNLSSALNFSLQQQPILFDDNDNDIHLNNKRPSDNKMDIEREKEIDIAEEDYSNNKQKADRRSSDQKEGTKTIISCFHQQQPNQVISKSFQIPSSKTKRNTN